MVVFLKSAAKVSPAASKARNSADSFPCNPSMLTKLKPTPKRRLLVWKG
jgi:hypothetical protein